MVDVGAEAGLAFDAFLKLVHHAVEGGGEHRHISEVGALEAGAQPPAGDRERRLGGLVQRAQRTARRPPADDRPGDRREQGGEGERREQHVQGAGEIGEVEDLEVGRLLRRDRHPDHEMRSALCPRRPAGRARREHPLLEASRQLVRRQGRRRRVPLVLAVARAVDERAGVRPGVERRDQFPDVGGRHAKLAPQQDGVRQGLVAHRGDLLVDESRRARRSR